MSEPKFTPGPWHAELAISKRFWVIYDKDSRYVADSYWSSTRAEEEANAHLLAAAPEMYDALVGVCSLMQKLHVCTKMCRDCKVGNALQKARGESEVEK